MKTEKDTGEKVAIEIQKYKSHLNHILSHVTIHKSSHLTNNTIGVIYKQLADLQKWLQKMACQIAQPTHIHYKPITAHLYKSIIHKRRDSIDSAQNSPEGKHLPHIKTHSDIILHTRLKKLQTSNKPTTYLIDNPLVKSLKSHDRSFSQNQETRANTMGSSIALDPARTEGRQKAGAPSSFLEHLQINRMELPGGNGRPWLKHKSLHNNLNIQNIDYVNRYSNIIDLQTNLKIALTTSKNPTDSKTNQLNYVYDHETFFTSCNKSKSNQFCTHTTTKPSIESSHTGQLYPRMSIYLRSLTESEGLAATNQLITSNALQNVSRLNRFIKDKQCSEGAIPRTNRLLDLVGRQLNVSHLSNASYQLAQRTSRSQGFTYDFYTGPRSSDNSNHVKSADSPAINCVSQLHEITHGDIPRLFDNDFPLKLALGGWLRNDSIRAKAPRRLATPLPSPITRM